MLCARVFLAAVGLGALVFLVAGLNEASLLPRLRAFHVLDVVLHIELVLVDFLLRKRLIFRRIGARHGSLELDAAHHGRGIFAGLREGELGAVGEGQGWGAVTTLEARSQDSSMLIRRVLRVGRRVAGGGEGG